jgi:hypothetical protein
MNALFWRATAERAVKTFAQTLAATLMAGGTDLLSVGWKQALSLAGMATLLSALTSIGSSTIGDPASPSLVGEGETPDAVRSVRTGRSGV